ncbi:hypothetical protein [Piscirickettsia salmonis]|uniref:hypothetical protein n=3 Tax=Piscirickettsia salmonis TaxID=1238 RepID=UPI00065F2EE0|nr:hypothetical protein [Piscirickettsia salmonis]
MLHKNREKTMVTLTVTDIHDLTVMLGMLEDIYQYEIPAAQRILKKIADKPESKSYHIVPTGLSSEKSIHYVNKLRD